jgi:hypothetical protein
MLKFPLNNSIIISDKGSEDMSKTDYTDLYNKTYALFRNTTPLTADCGILCGQRCCSGSDNEGMLLFPGEKTELEVKEDGERRLAVCKGHCNRDNRPLSCMIFPFFPAIDKNGKITAELDYRGVSLCPLIANSNEVAFNKKFLKRIAKAGRMLAENDECKRFLEEITGEINDAKELYQKIYQSS